MWRIYFIAPLITIYSFSAYAQHQESENQETVAAFSLPIQPNDSLRNLLHDYGKFEAHFRSYFLSTLNKGDSPDY